MDVISVPRRAAGADPGWTPRARTPVLGRLMRCDGRACTTPCPDHPEDQHALRRMGAGPLSTGTVPPVVHEVLRSEGQPLDGPTRAASERSLGHDFGMVRVHTDARAAEAARAVGALAFTVGRDVVFGAGQLQPRSPDGHRLLVHELVHVLQQGAGRTEPTTALAVSSPDDAEERAASATAASADAASPPGSVLSVMAGGGLQRQEASPGAGSPAPAPVGAPGASPAKAGPCAGWEADRESFSVAVARRWMTEVDPTFNGVAKKVECYPPPQPPWCSVKYSDDLSVLVSLSRVPDYVIALPDAVRSAQPLPVPNRRCEYEYECPGGQLHLKRRGECRSA